MLPHVDTVFAAVVCALFVAASAHALTPEAEANALVAEGARLGEAGAFDEAIARFRAAERVLPRAIHDCNLGLTYAMARRFPEAHALLARCVARATGPLPGWVDSDLASRFSMDPPTTGPPREVHAVEVLESPRRVFTAGAFTASLHDVDSKGNLLNASYAALDATDGYDAYAFTPHPPAGRLEVLAALEYDVVYSRYDVTGALYREASAHGASPAPLGTPDFAFVLDADGEDGVFELLFVDTAGNDATPKTLAVHWLKAVGGGRPAQPRYARHPAVGQGVRQSRLHGPAGGVGRARRAGA